jgi:hypothetical protein
MKTISDYLFYDSWLLNELNLKEGEEYIVLEDLCDLRNGLVVTFAGFNDIDNHYGICVFIDSEGAVLEVSGDFSGPEHDRVKKLKRAIKKV